MPIKNNIYDSNTNIYTAINNNDSLDDSDLQLSNELTAQIERQMHDLRLKQESKLHNDNNETDSQGLY